MYWRVRKLAPHQMAKQYGVHVALIFSVLTNALLILTRPATPKISLDSKTYNIQFAKTVTQHLLDTSYITYAQSTMALINDELAPPVVFQLRKGEMLAKSNEDLRAMVQQLTTQRTVSAVKIDEIKDYDLTPQGFMPVEVKGLVVVHSAEEASPAVPFAFKYIIGAKTKQDGSMMMMADGKTPAPLVIQFQDISPKPAG